MQAEQPDQQPTQSAGQSEPYHITRRERRHKQKMWWLIGGGAALILILAGLGYWFFLRDSGDKKQAAQSTSNQPETPDPGEETPPVDDPTPTSFKSTKLNIGFTHRKDWTVKETEGQVTLTSPETSYTGADGQAKMGAFTLVFRKDVPQPMATTIEKMFASRASKVIGYKEPTKDQRQYTNLSYVGSTKEMFNFFIVTGSTELKAGAALAYTLPLTGEFYLIVGGYGNPGSTLAFDSLPKANIDSEALEQAIAVVESLQIH